MQIRAQFDRVSRLLPLATKTMIAQLVPSYSVAAGSLRNPQAMYQAAIAAVRVKLPFAGPVQIDLLAFYLLSVTAVHDDPKGRFNSLTEMSEMTSMRLQMAMDRRSKFVEALSNIMKKIDSTQETIVQNLKG